MPAPPSAPRIPRDVLRRACQGDRDAQDSVFREYAPPLSRFASRLLPPHVRSMTDTHDVVQDVFASTARRLSCIDCDEEGALLAYLYRAVRHRVVDEVRRAGRRPPMGELDGDRHASREESPLEIAIQAEADQRLRTALAQLSARDRRAVILRLRHRLSYERIGALLDIPTANAARVAIRRAVERLARILAADDAARVTRSSRVASAAPARSLQPDAQIAGVDELVDAVGDEADGGEAEEHLADVAGL